MNLCSLKGHIFKLERKLGIDSKKRVYENALERHKARFDILYAKNMADAFDELKEIVESLNESDIDPYYGYNSLGEGDRLRQVAQIACELLGKDTPERWQNDQEILVTYHLNLLGNLSKLEPQDAFGSTPDEMWAHYESNCFAIRDAKDMSKRLCKEEKISRHAEIEKEFGKPIRLVPDNTDLTYKYYVPQFFEGDPHWNLRHVYPCEDFPEYDGKSVIELGKLGNLG